jgi:hypothetical protein
MQVQTQPVHQSWIGYAITIGVIAIVFALRIRSMSRERPLKVGTLWVVPVIYLAIIASMLFALPPTSSGWTVLATGVAFGVVLGWHRGKLIHIGRDAVTGQLMQRASPLAMVLLIALIVLKLGARAIFGVAAAAQPGSPGMLMTDGFIGFALGLLSATRLELFLRARSILDEN